MYLCLSTIPDLPGAETGEPAIRFSLAALLHWISQPVCLYLQVHRVTYGGQHHPMLSMSHMLFICCIYDVTSESSAKAAQDRLRIRTGT